MLDGILRGGSRPEGPVTVPLRGIVERRSSQILAADDPRVTRALRFMWDRLEEPLRSSDVADCVKTSRVTLDRHRA
jgi:LacI family transcriptional regulator